MSRVRTLSRGDWKSGPIYASDGGERERPGCVKGVRGEGRMTTAFPSIVEVVGPKN